MLLEHTRTDLGSSKGSTSILKGFMSAHEKVRAIEDEVSQELQKDWDDRDLKNQKKQEIDNNIEEFYQRMIRTIHK